MDRCETVRNLLALRADDWSVDERSEVEAHVQSCPNCAALAHTYAEQNRLLQVSRRVRLTSSQRAQLFSRIRQEGRQHKVHTRLSTVLGTVAAVIALVILGLGLFVLFRGQDLPAASATAVGLESPLFKHNKTATSVALPDVDLAIPMGIAQFADEITVTELSVQLASSQPVAFVPEQLAVGETVVLGESKVPVNVRLTFKWRLLAEPSANWRVFVHLFNEAGELAMQSDAAVHWPGVPCIEAESSERCTITSVHKLAFPADFRPGTYSVAVGLYDSVTGERAPVTQPAGATSSVVVGQMVLSESRVFADEIQFLELGTRFPSSVGVEGAAVPSGLGAFTVPADVGVSLVWQVVAQPSTSWRAFVHLLNGKGEVVLQSDLDVDWPAQPCANSHSGPECTVTTSHEWTLPDDFPPGTYAIVAGLYDPVTGRRAPLTSPPGVTPPQIELGQVRVLADASSAEPSPVPPQIFSPLTSPAPISPILPEFAIYLTAKNISPILLSQTNLSSLELDQQPILSSVDILHYSTDTHKIELTHAAQERINRLSVPTGGRSFVVAVGNELVYGGAFWTLASSQSYSGVVIEVPLIDESMRIQLGYPESLELFTGRDPRSDVRVIQALHQAGKLD